jgi:myosin heavy subunit
LKLWRSLIGILHLGNIEFKEGGTNTSAYPVDRQPLEMAANCLRIQPVELGKALVSQSVPARNDPGIRRELDAKGAEQSRDALAKAIYERLFSWVLGRLNQSIRVPERMIGKGRVIGGEIYY